MHAVQVWLQNVISDIEIKSAGARDLERLRHLYLDAFPDEDLFPLVSKLLGETAPVLSLMAASGGEAVGHVVFTNCTVELGGNPIALLGPLCVTPEHQKGGIGSTLVRTGFDHLKATVSQVMVLGDPQYYGRFGFRPDRHVEPPCQIPAEWKDAWQSVQLDDGRAIASGRLAVPDAWNNPVLWSD